MYIHIYKTLLNEKGGEGGRCARKRRGTEDTLRRINLTYYLYSLLIYTTYYLSNPSSQPAFTLGRRAHFGGPVRGSPYTRGTQCRGPEAAESVPNRRPGAATWPVTRIRGVAMLTLGFWAHFENARARAASRRSMRVCSPERFLRFC